MKKFLALALLMPAMAFAQTYPSPTFSSLTLQNPLTAANGGTGATSATGTGSAVLSNSPTLVTPALGTPSSVTLTNGTGLPVSGLAGLGTGVNSALGNSVTGSGGIVLSTSPTVSGLTVTGALTATGLITTADLATQAANTVLANASGSSASPTAISLPSCSTSASALQWSSGSGFACGTVASSGANSNITSLSGLTTSLSISQGGTGATTATGATSNLQYLRGSAGSTAVSLQSIFQRKINVKDFGATGNGSTDDTAAINAALSAALTVGNYGAEVDLPCGTYLYTTLTMPAGTSPYYNATHLVGQGACTILMQSSSSASSNGLTIGNNTLNVTGDVLIQDIFFNSQVAKTGGYGIFARGSARPTFKNVWMSNQYAGIGLDGVDFARFDHVFVFGPVTTDGIAIWDGYDCNGYTPVTQTTNAATTTSSNVIHLSNTSGIVVGMEVHSRAPNNTGTIGIVQSIVTNTSVTMAANAQLAVASGQTLLFGSDCGGTTATFTGDTTITGAVNGIAVHGGVGGVYIDSAHLYSSTHGFLSDTANSLGVPNRELFFFSGTDVDSNTSTGVYITNNSITKFIATGAWFNASATNGAVFIGPQTAGTNPVENGAVTIITGGVIGQSGGSGITWADTGTLTISGTDISYNYPASGTIGGTNGDGVVVSAGTGVGQVSVNGAKLRSNGRYGYAVFGTYPAAQIITNNIMTNNTTNSVDISPGTNAICTGNLGGSVSGC